MCMTLCTKGAYTVGPIPVQVYITYVCQTLLTKHYKNSSSFISCSAFSTDKQQNSKLVNLICDCDYRLIELSIVTAIHCTMYVNIKGKETK